MRGTTETLKTVFFFFFVVVVEVALAVLLTVAATSDVPLFPHVRTICLLISSTNVDYPSERMVVSMITRALSLLTVK